MDKLSIAIIAMEAHIACSNERLRQAWDIIHAKLVESTNSSHNKQSQPLPACITCAVPGCGMKAGYCGMYKPQ